MEALDEENRDRPPTSPGASAAPGVPTDAAGEDAGTPPAPPAPSARPQPLRSTRGPSEVALGAVLLVVVVGLALVGQDHWRRGLLLAGVGLLLGAGVRLVLPARLAGLLVVRGRLFDTVVLAGLGAAVIALTTSVPLPVGSG